MAELIATFPTWAVALLCALLAAGVVIGLHLSNEWADDDRDGS